MRIVRENGKPIDDESLTSTYADETGSAASSTSINMTLALHGQGLRQAQPSRSTRPSPLG